MKLPGHWCPESFPSLVYPLENQVYRKFIWVYGPIWESFINDLFHDDQDRHVLLERELRRDSITDDLAR